MRTRKDRNTKRLIDEQMEIHTDVVAEDRWTDTRTKGRRYEL